MANYSLKASCVAIAFLFVGSAVADKAADRAAALARMDALEKEMAELRRLNAALFDLPLETSAAQADSTKALQKAAPRLNKPSTKSNFPLQRRLRVPPSCSADELDPAADLQGALNHLWLLVCGALVMLMQAGFAMLEAGSCRAKNAQNLMLKNLADICLGTLCWWSFGYMIAYGTNEAGADNNFGGNKNYWGEDFIHDAADGIKCPTDSILAWFFQWAFCGAAATIVSGGVAERINFPAYICYTVCMTTFIYPTVVYWTWSGAGWLYGGEDAVTDIGYYDFAGSGIVHMTGGVGALMGATILGPRNGRFTPGNEEEFVPHRMDLVVLGTFILWFGWYGFNCGSTLGMDSTATGHLAAHVAMNTTIAAATGGLTVFLLRLALQRRYDVAGMCNGVLAGLVSITAPCGNVETFWAFFIAIIGGCIYQAASSGLQLAKIDDPLDAFPVHGACGAWGALAAVLFDWGEGTFGGEFNGWSGFGCTLDANGNCYKDGWKSAFGAQVVGIICIALWVVGWSLLILLPMRLLGVLRASDATQEMGMDVAKHSPTKTFTQDDGNTTKVHPAGESGN